MNHADVESCLADYLEGDLSLDRRALVDAHLDACAECGVEVDQMRRMIRLLRLLPEPETPPMIAANVMRRIRAGETRPGLLARLARTLGTILEPGFVLPSAAVASAALVWVVWQDPSVFRQGSLGPRLEAGLERTGVGPAKVDSSVGASHGRSAPVVAPLVASVGPETGRVFGAPVARDFRVVASGPEARSMRDQPDPARRTASMQTRILIQLEPMPSRGSSFLQDPLLAPLGSSPFGLLETAFAGGAARGSRDWPEAERWAPGPREARLSVTKSQPLPPIDPSAGSSSGSAQGDKRDEWIARLLEDPTGFAHFLASQNLAEQELWIARLSERAETRGLLEDLVAAMRASGDPVATLLAEDFLAGAVGASGGEAQGPVSR